MKGFFLKKKVLSLELPLADFRNMWPFQKGLPFFFCMSLMQLQFLANEFCLVIQLFIHESDLGLFCSWGVAHCWLYLEHALLG